MKYFVTFILLLLLSAFFSGSEVAFFTLNQNHLKQIAERFKITHKISTYLLKYPSKLLVTILICNTIVNVSIAIVAVYITIDIIKLTSSNELLSVFVEIILVTIFLLLIGEITPKIIARKYPIHFSRFAALPLFIIYLLILPISQLFEYLTSSINFIFKIKTNEIKTPDLELKYVIDLIHSKSNIDTHTKSFLKKLNEFSNLNAKDILIPRVKLNPVEIKSSVESLRSHFSKTKALYIPIYESSVDNIIGVISLKTILKINVGGEHFSSKINYELLEKPLYVPETKRVKDLLLEMQKSSVSVAVIIDEHGGFAGMITEEDILKIFYS